MARAVEANYKLSTLKINAYNRDNTSSLCVQSIQTLIKTLRQVGSGDLMLYTRNKSPHVTIGEPCQQSTAFARELCLAQCKLTASFRPLRVIDQFTTSAPGNQNDDRISYRYKSMMTVSGCFFTTTSSTHSQVGVKYLRLETELTYTGPGVVLVGYR